MAKTNTTNLTIKSMKDIDSVPSNVQSARQEALLYVFEDNEAVIKMIMKGRSLTMRHVSRTHRVALDWLFDRINLDPRIQIKYIDTKNQLADILTKGNFTRGEWNHLLCLFNLSHFSSTACTTAMEKRAQQGSGEERVTAKSRPMMNLTARMPSVVSSSTSSNPGRTSYGYQDPGKSVASDDRSAKPEKPSPPGYSKEDYGQSWSSQEWKSGAAEHDRSGKPEKTSWDVMQQVAPHRGEPLRDGNAHSVRYGETIHDGSGEPEKLNYQEEADSETFVMGSDAAEFVNKVKDQVRCRQKRMSNVAESGEEHSIIWGIFMAATMNAATFMGKNFSTIQNFIMNLEDLTLKQMFDVTAQLVNDQEEIHGLDKIHWGKNSWRRLSLIGDETVINLQSTKVYVFSDSVLCLEGSINIQIPTKLGRTELQGSYPRKASEIMMVSVESRLNSSGISSQDSQRCSSAVKSMIYRTWEKHKKLSQEEFYLCQCSMTSPVTEKATKKNVWHMPESSKYLQRKLVLDNGHLLDQVLKRSGILWKRIAHKEFAIMSRKRCCRNSQKADDILSVQRLHCPGVNSRAKDMENCQYTSLQMN